MKKIIVIAVLAAATALGCTRIQPDWTIDPNLDLSGRTTFRIETANVPTGLDADEQSVWTERRQLIRGLIRDDLTAKGYTETAENPDLIVHFFGIRGSDYAQEHHYDETKGKIDIHMADPAGGEWLWHGWASETLTKRLDVEEEIRNAVAMILEKFPPAS